MPHVCINSEGEQLSAAALTPTLDVEQNPENESANHVEVHQAVPLFSETNTNGNNDLFAQPIEEIQQQRIDSAHLVTDGQPLYKEKLFQIRLLILVVAVAAMGGYLLSSILEKKVKPDASQVAALVALYESTNGASWQWPWFYENNNWMSAEPVCKWHGVTCKGGGITRLRMEDTSLRGSIPTEIGNLKQLEYLMLDGNMITGTLPSTLGNLSNLKWLSLPRNNISGSIPSTFGNLNNLQFMDLHKNRLSGSIPSTLGNLSKLEYMIILNHNSISGTIPSDLGRLSMLLGFDADYNELTGSIPTTFGNLRNLENLNLRGNNLSGTIPSTLGNLNSSVMESISLIDNSLTGTIPTELGRLIRLSNLWLSGNDLTGTMPDEVWGLQCGRGMLNIAVDCIEVKCPCCQWCYDVDNICEEECV